MGTLRGDEDHTLSQFDQSEKTTNSEGKKLIQPWRLFWLESELCPYPKSHFGPHLMMLFLEFQEALGSGAVLVEDPLGWAFKVIVNL